MKEPIVVKYVLKPEYERYLQKIRDEGRGPATRVDPFFSGKRRKETPSMCRRYCESCHILVTGNTNTICPVCRKTTVHRTEKFVIAKRSIHNNIQKEK